MGKCNSCKNGYNGTNGNGYQPCDCKNKQDLPIGVESKKSSDFTWGVCIGFLFGMVLTVVMTVFLLS